VSKTYSRLALAALLLCALLPRSAWSQTPSPLPEWQYSAGIILSKLFEPNLPDWFRVVGAAVETQPVYAGAAAYEVQAGPVINILYKDIAFISTGDGIGVNLLRGDHYRVGVALAYDLGRRESEDYTNLRGLGNISPAPAAKVFASYVLSKKFPLVLRVDARQILGGVNGTVGDVGLYMPLPGSSRKFVMFAGPTATFATHRYLQSEFGVTLPQSRTSGRPVFTTHSGIESVGAGFTATRFLSAHWLINVDLGISKFRGSAQSSPLTEASIQREAALSVDYQW
jgi:outer membrane scaffolding protein for murein synthesis (MipA/OmpV family)